MPSSADSTTSPSLDLAAIREIFEHRPLTADLVESLNPRTDLTALTETLDTIGYPSTGANAP
ncbi:hypothetical protein OHR68_37145 [Spirillospora sp. NBC_00431]